MNAPISAPAGFPRGAWTAYTPTITAGAGTFTSVAGAGRYLRVGKTLWISIRITVTTQGSAASFIICPLPAGMTAANSGVGYYLSGVESAASGLGMDGSVAPNSTQINITTTSGTFRGSSGDVLNVTGVIELA